LHGVIDKRRRMSAESKKRRDARGGRLFLSQIDTSSSPTTITKSSYSLPAGAEGAQDVDGLGALVVGFYHQIGVGGPSFHARLFAVHVVAAVRRQLHTIDHL